MNTLKITYDSVTQFCLLRHGYNRRFSDFMKCGISPLSYRRWVTDRKSWEVHISKLPHVVSVARRFFGYVDYSDLPENLQINLVMNAYEEPTKAAPVVSTPYEVLHLLPSAPREVVKAAYKALALLHHPDHGGDAELFKEINLAYESISDSQKKD